MKRRRRPKEETPSTAAWTAWVADNMQQRERGLSPHEESTPSALILLPLLGLPVLLVVATVLIFVLS
jgi:hypothetical protein